MNKLFINKMEYAYGIRSLRINVPDKCLMKDIIYSRNGVFKTSFAKTLYSLSNGNVDDIYDRITGHDSIIDLKIIDENNDECIDYENKFIVFSRDIYERENKRLSDFNNEFVLIATDENEKNNIEDVNTRILEIETYVMEQCKNVNVKYDDFVKELNYGTIGNIDNLLRLFTDISSTELKDISKINMKTIFQKTYDAINTDEFKKSAQNYVDIYKKRLNIPIFDDRFNELNLYDVVSCLEKNSFLNREKNRGIILDGDSIYDIDDLNEKYNSIIDQISSDPDIIKANNIFAKSLGTSKEANILKNELINDPLYVSQLTLGRPKIVMVALKKNGIECNKYINELEELKEQVYNIYDRVNNKRSEFDKALEIYLKRFKPNFNITIENRTESLLGIEIPEFKFNHINYKDYYLSEDEIHDILSSGEKTAINIIVFLVELLSNRDNPFIILDDVVETFDYSNRFAFIEYINDLVKRNYSIIVLTHNYEFYKTVQKRVDGLRPLEAVSNKGKVVVSKNSNLNTKIENMHFINSKKQLIFSIPYFREASNILGEDITKLTEFLHYGKNFDNLKLSDIKNNISKNIIIDSCISLNDNYYSTLKNIVNKFDKIDNSSLIDKTILSMYLRVTIEKKIVQDDFSLIQGIEENQLRVIKDKCSESLTDTANDILESIILSTPEFIHINSFMYEPLIDIDAEYLLKIKENLDKLEYDNVWK